MTDHDVRNFEDCVEAMDVHQAGWGGSGVGGQTLEERYGACSSIRCWSWWMNKRTHKCC
jgi:hypothetical protein